MRDHGAEFPDIELRQVNPFLRGVYAKRDFKEGETMLFVPDKLCLTLDLVHNGTDFGRILVEKNLTDNGQDRKLFMY